MMCVREKMTSEGKNVSILGRTKNLSLHTSCVREKKYQEQVRENISVK